MGNTHLRNQHIKTWVIITLLEYSLHLHKKFHKRIILTKQNSQQKTNKTIEREREREKLTNRNWLLGSASIEIGTCESILVMSVK